MADFDIDVDCPFEKPQKELLDMKPEKLPYPQRFSKISVLWKQHKTHD